MSEKKISKIEQESHMRIFNENVVKDEFDGIYITGNFEEPALILKLEKLPNKSGLNIMKNNLSFKDDNPLFLYFYVEGKGYKIGKIEEDIREIYLLEELLKRNKLEMIEVKDGKQRKVTSIDFISTLKL